MTSTDTQLYFAYGSNMDPKQMRERCPGATSAGQATLPGYRFLINARGKATVTPSVGAKVVGVLWHVTPKHLVALDEKEGTKHGTYARSEIEVATETGPAHALVYIAANATEGKPTSEHIERILARARANGLPAEYIARTFGPYSTPAPRSAPGT